jgi:hypothetical protein
MRLDGAVFASDGPRAKTGTSPAAAHGEKPMKAITCLASALVLAVLAAQAPAAQRLPADETAKQAVAADAAIMTAECKLTDDQQATLKDKVKAKQETIDAWYKTNADKLKAAEEAAKQAKTGDPAAKKKAGDDKKALQADLAKASSQIDAEILAMLTADQKKTWEGALFCQTTLAKYKKVNLTEEQTAKVKAASMVAGRQLSDATAGGDDRAIKKAKGDIEGKLKWAIDFLILTPEQCELVTKKPAPKAGAPAPAPATTPAPAPK